MPRKSLALMPLGNSVTCDAILPYCSSRTSTVMVFLFHLSKVPRVPTVPTVPGGKDGHSNTGPKKQAGGWGGIVGTVGTAKFSYLIKPIGRFSMPRGISHS